MQTIIRSAVVALVVLCAMSAHAAEGSSPFALPDCPALSQPMLPPDPPASAGPIDTGQAIDLLLVYADVFEKHRRQRAQCISLLNAADGPYHGPITEAYVTGLKERTSLRLRLNREELDELALVHHLVRAMSARATPEARRAMARAVEDDSFDDGVIEQARKAEDAFAAAFARCADLLESMIVANAGQTETAEQKASLWASAKQSAADALAQDKAFHAAMRSLRHLGVELPESAYWPKSPVPRGSGSVPPPPPPPPPAW